MALGHRQQELEDTRELLRGLINERDSIVRLRENPEAHERNLADLIKRRDHYQSLIDDAVARWSGAEERLDELAGRITELQAQVKMLKYRKELDRLAKLQRKYEELSR